MPGHGGAADGAMSLTGVIDLLGCGARSARSKNSVPAILHIHKNQDTCPSDS
ncbi:MAG: hypothetical protein ACOYIF_02400 [Acetivibrionales bacterium]